MEHVGAKDIEVTRRAKLLGDPFELALDRLQLIVVDDIGKDGDGGAQTPETDAHLMQGFGVAGAHRRLVGHDLPEAALRDGAKRFAGLQLGRNVDVGGFLDLEAGLKQLVAALGLGLDLEPERHGRGREHGRGETTPIVLPRLSSSSISEIGRMPVLVAISPRSMATSISEPSCSTRQTWRVTRVSNIGPNDARISAVSSGSSGGALDSVKIGTCHSEFHVPIRGARSARSCSWRS